MSRRRVLRWPDGTTFVDGGLVSLDVYLTTLCPDCSVPSGIPHAPGCDVARCLEDGQQRIQCFEEHDHGHDVWTGKWPGVAECLEWGWFQPGTDDADLNRLFLEAHGPTPTIRWSREAARYVLPDNA